MPITQNHTSTESAPGTQLSIVLSIVGLLGCAVAAFTVLLLTSRERRRTAQRRQLCDAQDDARPVEFALCPVMKPALDASTWKDIQPLAMARLAHRLPLQSLDGVEPGKPQSTPPTQNTTQSRLQLPNSVPQPPLSVAVLIAMPIAPPAAATVDHSFPQETDPAPENIVIGISQTWFLEEGHRR